MSSQLKILLHTLLAVLTLLVSAVFWHEARIVVPLLAAISIAMLLVERTKSIFALYLTIFILGPLAESAFIARGAWSYAAPHVLGFSIWLPLLWGNAAIYIAGLKNYIDHIYGRT